MPTRLELRELSEKRLEAIKLFYEQELHDFVCQDCGYILEFGLKSAVCKSINVIKYPDKEAKYRTHCLSKLINLANLKNKLEARKNQNIDFFVNWSLVSKWSVEFRYEPIGTNKKENAEAHIDAIENPKDGVYPWVKENW